MSLWVPSPTVPLESPTGGVLGTVRAAGCGGRGFKAVVACAVQCGDDSCRCLVLVREDAFLNDVPSVPLELGIAQGAGIMSKLASFPQSYH